MHIFSLHLARKICSKRENLRILHISFVIVFILLESVYIGSVIHVLEVVSEILLRAVIYDLEMQVRSRGIACTAYTRYIFSLRYRLSNGYRYGVQMRVTCLEASRMVYKYAVAVAARSPPRH